jgi:creatinine amidohydrolase/Fe(II)-dependent formamide hydrolase-like protein
MRHSTLRLRAAAVLLALMPVSAIAQGAWDAGWDPRSMGGGDCAANALNCRDAPNPLPNTDTVWLEEMTWMEVRDALAAGKRTALIPTGGHEPNGPFVALGKHNVILQANCAAIARQLDNALCAPVIKHVPEGGIDPPTGHMRSPGTISLREDTFRALLTDTAESLIAGGFTEVYFIGDSGGNQAGQAAVAEALGQKYAGRARIAQVAAYYDYDAVIRHMANKGLAETTQENLHDDAFTTLNMFVVDPESVRFSARQKAGLSRINGVDLSNVARNRAWGEEIVAFRAAFTADAIRKIRGNSKD